MTRHVHEWQPYHDAPHVERCSCGEERPAPLSAQNEQSLRAALAAARLSVTDFDAILAAARESMGQAKVDALREARDDIRARIATFRDLNADDQYLNALNDAWGLVANRLRDVSRPPGDRR